MENGVFGADVKSVRWFRVELVANGRSKKIEPIGASFSLECGFGRGLGARNREVHHGAARRTPVVRRECGPRGAVHDGVSRAYVSFTRCSAVPGREKRGGARVIYFWRPAESQILVITRDAIKSRVRAKGEHPLLILKKIFGFTKVHYRGPHKNANRVDQRKIGPASDARIIVGNAVSYSLNVRLQRREFSSVRWNA